MEIFKGYKDNAYTFGQVQLQDGNELKYFIESGNGPWERLSNNWYSPSSCYYNMIWTYKIG